MQLAPVHIREFKGVSLQRDTTDQKPGTLLSARNAVLRPLGGLATPPPALRLWGTTPLSEYLDGLSLTTADKTVLLKVSNEGHQFLVFYDTVRAKCMGVFYGGADADALSVTAKPTLTLDGAEFCVLWKKLQTGLRWGGNTIMGLVVMGNGCDANLVWDAQEGTIRRMGDHVRPLFPQATATDVSTLEAHDASFTYDGILYQALEPGFDPVNEETYERANGNNVVVNVAQGGVDYFDSLLEGKGTWAEPYEYTAIVPATLPTNEQMVNFIQTDPNAAGIVNATLLEDRDEVTLFSGARLEGGITSFDESDVFKSPQVDVVTTYFRRDSRNIGFESAPSPIFTCKEVGAQRMRVTVTKDDLRPGASEFDAIRIYVSAYTVQEQGQGWAYDGQTFNYSAGETVATDGFATRGYRAFKLALEVPNEDGTYLIAPSLLNDGTELNAEMKMPRPATQFTFAYGRIWSIGDQAHPLRLHYTREFDPSEALFPENTETQNYVTIPSDDPSDRLTAISSYRNQLVAYTKRKARLVPVDWLTAGTAETPVHSGAINQRCAINWTDGQQYYIGGDFNLYRMRQPTDTDDSSAAPVSQLMAPGLGDYLQEFADTTQGSLAHSEIDYLNRQWWFWLITQAGTYKGFCFDFEEKELTGPFDFPEINASCRINDADSRIVGCDDLGNLWVVDLEGAANRFQAFDNTEAVTLYESADSIPAAYAEHSGRGVIQTHAIGDPAAVRYILDGQLMEWETGWLYARQPGDLVGWYKIQWSTVQGSAGHVTIKIEDDNGNVRTYYYGEVYGRRNPHTQIVMFKGRAVRFTLQAATGDGKPFALRDASLWYKPHKGSL